MQGRHMQLTIKEIAAIAGVSKGTVSKALNGRAGVSQVTTTRIKQLVEQLGYQPSATAQALASRRTGTIGLVIPHESALSLDGAYWSGLMTAITREAILHGYHLSILIPSDPADIAGAYRAAVGRRTIDGLIVAAEDLDRPAIAELLVSQLPFVLIGRSRTLDHFCVDVDNYQGAYDMTTYMVEHEYRRIAMIAGPVSYHYTRERVRGYQDALRDAGIEGHPVVHAEYEGDMAGTLIRQLMADENPDGLFVGAGGVLLLETLRTLRLLGIDPYDLGVTVFDDYTFMDFLAPRITAIRQPLSTMGGEATRMLLRLVEGGEPPSSDPVIFQPTLIPRESCGETGTRDVHLPPHEAFWV
jgi:DNA-binding LacI/PurR family transcriptional regulator